MGGVTRWTLVGNNDFNLFSFSIGYCELLAAHNVAVADGAAQLVPYSNG